MSSTKSSQAIIALPKARIVNLNTTSLWRRAIRFFSKIFKKKETVVKVEVEKTAEEIRVEKKVSFLLGEACLKEGRLDYAIEAFKAGGDKAKLIECGKACIEKGWLKNAVEAFKAGGRKISKAELIECGDACLKGGCLGDAVEAFKAAGDKAKIIKCAEAFIARKQINFARKVFEVAVLLEE